MNFNRTTRKLRAISMVSLIDIVFTMILFFLVAGHLEKFSPVAVDLPKADAGQRLDEGPVVVVLGKYGDVMINDALLEGKAVDGTLARELSVNPDRVVTIKADALLEANRLVDFLNKIRAAGGRNLSIVTDSSPVAEAP